MQIKLNVKGMHCGSCELLIKDSLLEQNGVKEVKANHKNGFVQIVFDEKIVNEKKIKEIIQADGYEV